jgi:hypothetical protein
MSKFKDYLLNEKAKAEAFLIEDNRDIKTKTDYVKNAEPGLIVAFRLNFTNKDEKKLTKVISGKIAENNQEEDLLIIETKNGLKYGVPYTEVLWVKTSDRWPKGIYDEMKRGSVEVEDDEEFYQAEDASSVDYE